MVNLPCWLTSRAPSEFRLLFDPGWDWLHYSAACLLLHWSRCHCLGLSGVICLSLGICSLTLADLQRGWVQVYLVPGHLDQQCLVELLSGSGLLSGHLRYLGDLQLWPGEWVHKYFWNFCQGEHHDRGCPSLPSWRKFQNLKGDKGEQLLD